MSTPHTQKSNSPLLTTPVVTGQPILKEANKKQTVLESHGYILGKTIGSGSYATVRVCLNHLVLFKNSPKITYSDGT